MRLDALITFVSTAAGGVVGAGVGDSTPLGWGAAMALLSYTAIETRRQGRKLDQLDGRVYALEGAHAHGRRRRKR